MITEKICDKHLEYQAAITSLETWVEAQRIALQYIEPLDAKGRKQLASFIDRISKEISIAQARARAMGLEE